MLLLRFLHSPGRLTQSQTKAVAPDLPVRKRFGEDVGRHIVSRTVDHVDGPIRYDFADEVEADVDVFGACMIVVVLREFECGLVVAEQRHCGRE